MFKKSICFLLVTSVFIMTAVFASVSGIESMPATKLKKQTYCRQLQVTGVVEAQNSTRIALSYPVIIKKCLVEENNYVNMGQLLFVLDTESMENAVKSTDFTQYAEVFSSLKKSQIAGLEANIYATKSGFVRNIGGNDGDFVLSGENLCVIESDNNLMLKITLSQQDYAKISVGDVVQFYPATAPEKLCYGTINRKTAVIRNEKSLTGSKTVVDVFADIDSASKSIVQGVQFSGTVSDSIAKTIYTLPYSFIGQDEVGEYVTVFADGKGEKQYVETGTELENSVEIITAFAEDTLFLHNSYDKGKVIVDYEP